MEFTLIFSSQDILKITILGIQPKYSTCSIHIIHTHFLTIEAFLTRLIMYNTNLTKLNTQWTKLMLGLVMRIYTEYPKLNRNAIDLNTSLITIISYYVLTS